MTRAPSIPSAPTSGEELDERPRLRGEIRVLGQEAVFVVIRCSCGEAFTFMPSPVTPGDVAADPALAHELYEKARREDLPPSFVCMACGHQWRPLREGE